jgi:hypothetical protein
MWGNRCDFSSGAFSQLASSYGLVTRAITCAFNADEILFRLVCNTVITEWADVAVCTGEKFGVSYGLRESDIIKVHHISNVPKVFIV